MTERIYYNENEYIQTKMEIEPIPTPTTNIQTNKNVSIETNTTTEITPDENYDALAKVTVTTQIPQQSLITNNIYVEYTYENPYNTTNDVLPIRNFTKISDQYTTEFPITQGDYWLKIKKYGTLATLYTCMKFYTGSTTPINSDYDYYIYHTGITSTVHSLNHIKFVENTSTSIIFDVFVNKYNYDNEFSYEVNLCSFNKNIINLSALQ